MRMSTGEYVIFVAPTALQLQIFASSFWLDRQAADP
jgi:hypothetical protein